jgi:hypothetical protein
VAESARKEAGKYFYSYLSEKPYNYVLSLRFLSIVFFCKKRLKKLFYTAFAYWQNFSDFPATLAGKVRNNGNGNSDCMQAASSVAKGPKFRPQNSKGALQKFVRPEKIGGRFFSRFA